MLRLAKRDDIPQIAKIEQVCFADVWTEDMLLQSFDSGCVFVVIEENNQIVGYGGLYMTGDITNIAVLPAFRGKGYGGAIIQYLSNFAKEKNIDSLFLEVRKSNEVAIKLYEKCGFKLINVRKKYYKDGEDALIYSLGGV